MRLLLLLVPLLLLAACREQPATSDAFLRQQQAEAPAGRAPGTGEAPAAVATARVVYAQIDGNAVTGFLARPPGTADALGTGAPDLAAVLLVHDWWGLDAHIQEQARSLASDGYLVLAADLYEGQSAATAEEAQRLLGEAMQDETRLENNLRQAVHYLTEQERAARIGILGWSFGGMLALRAALAHPRVDAVVMVYGHPELERDRLAALNTPLLALFGGQDTSIPLSDVERFERTLEDLDKRATVEIVDGVGHGFAHPSGPRYDAGAAGEAWSRARTFLAYHLQRQSPPSE